MYINYMKVLIIRINAKINKIIKGIILIIRIRLATELLDSFGDSSSSFQSLNLNQFCNNH